MWRFDPPLSAARPGAQAFLDALAAFERGRSGRERFDADRPVIVARAPGRLDLMGGIADYSGSLVLEWPLECATWAAIQPASEDMVTIASANAAAAGDDETITLGFEDLLDDYDAVCNLFASNHDAGWAAYVAGALTVLARERDVTMPRGMRLFVWSDVPIGAGVSSSAALEVAAMRAICGLLEVEIDGRSLALLCQTVENRIAGAACGVMDQMASACGRAGELVALLCQPAELEPPVRLPDSLLVFGVDSGVRHEVRGADYASVRGAAFMGYRILADLAGLRSERIGDGRVRIDDPRWRGYLSNVTPVEWADLEREVPESLCGRDFLARYGESTDAVTRIDRDRVYAVRAATGHPIREHARVREFRDLLSGRSPSDGDLARLGALMAESHSSYSACGLGSAGTDRVVELVRGAGPTSGLLGAKITGGGSGGTVAVLARRGADDSVRRIAQTYARESGRAADVVSGTSDGAMAAGVLRIVATA